MHRLVAVVGVGWMLATAGVAAAEPTAALVPQLKPSATPELRDRLHEAVVRGLQAAGSDEAPLPAAEVRLRLGNADELFNCDGSAQCVSQAAMALRVNRVVTTEVKVDGKEYAIALKLLDGGGRELTHIEEPCDICTVKEAEAAVERAATKLATSAHALPPPIAATPEPAKVEMPKPTPPPVIETPQQPDATTAPPVVAEKPAPPERKPFPWRPVAIASTVVGGALFIVGIPLLAIDGHPTCSLPDAKMACPDVYNTVGGGAAMLTLGLVGLAAGGTLFYFDHRERAQHKTTAFIGGSNGSLTVGGRF